MRDLGGWGSELQWKEVEIFSLRREGNEIKLNIGMLQYVSIGDEVRDGPRVARRSRSGSDMQDCASRKSRTNASTIRQGNKSGNVPRERILLMLNY